MAGVCNSPPTGPWQARRRGEGCGLFDAIIESRQCRRDCGDSVGDQFESALTSARSVTTKIYDRASGGAEHSQLGAPTLLQWRENSAARPPRCDDWRPLTPAGESRAQASRHFCLPSRSRRKCCTAVDGESVPLSDLSTCSKMRVQDCQAAPGSRQHRRREVIALYGVSDKVMLNARHSSHQACAKTPWRSVPIDRTGLISPLITDRAGRLGPSESPIQGLRFGQTEAKTMGVNEVELKRRIRASKISETHAPCVWTMMRAPAMCNVLTSRE